MGDGWWESHKSHTAGDDPWLQWHIPGNKQNRKIGQTVRYLPSQTTAEAEHPHAEEAGRAETPAENSPDLSLVQ